MYARIIATVRPVEIISSILTQVTNGCCSICTKWIIRSFLVCIEWASKYCIDITQLKSVEGALGSIALKSSEHLRLFLRNIHTIESISE